MEVNVKKAKVWNVWTRKTAKGNLAATLNVSVWLTKDKKTGENVSSWLQIKCFGKDAEVAQKIKTGESGRPVDNTYISFRVPTLKIDNTKTSNGYFYIVDVENIVSSATDIAILEAEPRKQGFTNPTKSADSGMPF